MADTVDSTDSAGSDEEFEDARADAPASASVMDLHTGIEDTKVTLKLFLNNRFKDALATTEEWSDRSMYHALGKATILFLQAVLTFDKENIDIAINAVKKSLAVCNQFRHRGSYMETLRNLALKVDYDLYTDEEVHAELCYAECLLERALLSFIQDENLVSFIKGALKINTGYKCYKQCARMLKARQWEPEAQKDQFESGVRLGVGAFNLLISQLPSRILKLLEFVGFSGDKGIGLRELSTGTDMYTSLRGPLCALILMAYHTLISYILGTGDGNIAQAEEIIKPYLVDYPKSAIILYFSGRIEMLKGNIGEAIVRLEQSVSSQEEWRQFHHLCFWDLMWCHAYRSEWDKAHSYCQKLKDESRWSRATYTYQKGVFLTVMAGSKGSKESKSKDEVTAQFKEVPKLIQRIAGKSLPVEKFALKKVEMYKAQGNKLLLPALEIIYVWNGFSMLQYSPHLMKQMLELVDEGFQHLHNNQNKFEFYSDNLCLVLFLRGVCLRYTKEYALAENCFKEVISRKSDLEWNTYLYPWGLMELAMVKTALEDYEEATRLLEKALNLDMKYSLTALLHFKIHSGLSKIKSLTDNGNNGNNGNEAQEED